MVRQADGSYAPGSPGAVAPADRPVVAAQAWPVDNTAAPATTGVHPVALRVHRTVTSGRPLSPEQAGGRWQYVKDVAGAGTRRIPEQLNDWRLNRQKFAHLREGGHHSGEVLPQNRNAYETAQRERSERRRQLMLAVFTKRARKTRYSGHAKITSEGRGPRWTTIGIGAAEIAELSYPTSPYLAPVRVINDLLGGAVTSVAGHVGEAAWAALQTPLGLAGVGAAVAGVVGSAAATEHRRRQEARTVLQSQDGNADVASDTDDGLLTMAFRAAGIIAAATASKPGQHVTLVAPIISREDCWVAELELPRGCTVSKVRQRHEALAGALDADTDRVLVLKGATDRRVTLRVYEALPLSGDGAAYPLATAAAYDLWDGAPFGLDLYGRPVVIDMPGNHSFAGGATRNGKTFSERVKLSAAVLDPYVRITLADFKPVGDWAPVRKVAHSYIEGTEEAALTRLRDALLDIQVDLSRRMGLLSSPAAAKHGAAGQVNRAMTRDPELNCPLWVVVIDEIQQAVGDPRKGDRNKESVYLQILTLLEDIARRGAALGVMLCLSTQAPDGNILPGPMWDQLGIRFALSVGDTDTSDAVLGKGSAKAGADASDLVHQQQRGAGYLKGTRAQAERFLLTKSYNVSAPLFDDLCDRGRAARIQAGTLSGQAAAIGKNTAAAPVDDQPGQDTTEQDATTVEDLPQLLDALAGYVDELLADGDDRDAVPTSELHDQCAPEDMTLTKFGRELNRMGIAKVDGRQPLRAVADIRRTVLRVRNGGPLHIADTPQSDAA